MFIKLINRIILLTIIFIILFIIRNEININSEQQNEENYDNSLTEIRKTWRKLDPDKNTQNNFNETQNEKLNQYI
ncbi:hypothetical protein [Candidatus Phytoplasma citri]|uniref:Uncharacterized protein n=1 Tax=Candidatus Phytoplasma citri TaxID=180978 RepID=A0A1S9M2J8_9MOLU|nr:hypothetical protein [Candidatus Phytoplasma aurantifolia]MDO8060293.1 hypothetical protein [Candidatus Phytoplasma aurantifolia]OOP59313.1 hypothetical protein B2G44_00930 [Candidatus Phytoplasma aurantifolia]